jgi:thiamine-phosphate pyrophosphorylase
MALKRRRPRDWRLYLVLDRALVARDARLIRIAREALAEGVSALQLRDKRSGLRETIRLARRIKDLCERRRVPFIVNDRVEVALAVDADGLHVGQSDIPAPLARTLLGKGKILGVSARSLREASMAQESGADYIGAGPVFETPVKKGERPISPTTLREIARLKVPAVLIGGIDERNAGGLVSKGFRRVAVIRAVLGSRTPRLAVKRLKEIVTS